MSRQEDLSTLCSDQWFPLEGWLLFWGCCNLKVRWICGESLSFTYSTITTGPWLHFLQLFLLRSCIIVHALHTFRKRSINHDCVICVESLLLWTQGPLLCLYNLLVVSFKSNFMLPTILTRQQEKHKCGWGCTVVLFVQAVTHVSKSLK